MRIVFMGTPEFAVPILERLIQDGHEIPAVFTQPDRPAGRGLREPKPPAVKSAALRYGLAVFQPVKMKDGAVAAQLREIAPDLAVVAAYGRILPKDILDAPKLGCVNLHASLLPKYRGAAPIQWSVINGDPVTGVTSMMMAEGLDTGDILLQRQTPVGEAETAPELTIRLSQMGADCISETVRLFENGTVNRIPQEESQATLAPILTSEDGRLSFAWTANQILCRIRGVAGWPGAFASFRGKRVKIYQAAPAAGFSGAAGAVLSDKRLIVGCAEGAVELLEVQPEGKRRMPGVDFLHGQRIKPNELFTER